MIAMQSFYVKLSARASLQESYLKALAKLTRLTRKQIKPLASELGWQDW